MTIRRSLSNEQKLQMGKKIPKQNIKFCSKNDYFSICFFKSTIELATGYQSVTDNKLKSFLNYLVMSKI